MNSIKVFVITFDLNLPRRDVVGFRGAINTLIADNTDILFHNHTDEGLRNSYPLIQYKPINHKASIVCIENGVDVIGKLLVFNDKRIIINQKEYHLNILSSKANNILINVWNTAFRFKITNWLALNKDNYNQYLEIESLADKLHLLEKILVGNVLSFLKGINIYIEERIECKILSISDPKLSRYKGVDFMVFDAIFSSNISLPNYIGLGKGSSVGYGIIKQIIKRKDIENE